MAEHPNVLLFFTDQLRFDMIHALGNLVIKTPNLDRIVGEGTAFTSTYSPCPVCVPARACMHYGQYPKSCGSYENNYSMPTDGRPSFMQTLTDAGYRTHGIGKCHFSPEANAMRGFETREHQEEIRGDIAEDDYLQFLHENGFKHVCDPHGIRGEMYYVPQPAQMPAELHPTQWIGDRSVNFIEEQENSEQPWFLFSSFVHPHPPFAPPNPWHKLYRSAMVPLPKMPQNQEALYTWINRNQNRYKYRDQGVDNNLLRCMRAYYMACVSFIDFQIGRICDALGDRIDNTLILFTSDHGEHLGDYGCFGKRSMHDSCARIPMLARLPERFAPGTSCAVPASLVDVAPTILAAAGVEPGGMQLDGADLSGIAGGDVERDEVFIQYETGSKAIHSIITSEYKYTWSAGDQQEYLFDRRGDPDETRNRAGVAFVQGQRQALKEKLLAFLADDENVGIVENNDWKVFEKIVMPEDPDTGLLIQDHPWAETEIAGYSTS